MLAHAGAQWKAAYAKKYIVCS